MVAFPHCKINLGLRVLNRREDGFHNIETCFYPLPWNEVLEIIPAQTMSFTNTGIVIPGRQEDNMCLKAYYILQEKFKLPPVAIHLHKIVPMGAGLGGGSSDGVFTIKLLRDVFQLDLSNEELIEVVSSLGSDCTFFTHKAPMIGTGKGDKLKPVNLSLNGKYAVVVKPPVSVSTADAYKEIKSGKSDQSIEVSLEQHRMSDWKKVITNDFELPVFKHYPEIEKIKNDLYHFGALYASMSGSGSAVFGIFDSVADLKSKFPKTTYWSGWL